MRRWPTTRRSSPLRTRPCAVTLTGQDVDGDSLSFSVATGPSHGTLSGALPNLTYTPALDFVGSDSFTFTASDGAATQRAGDGGHHRWLRQHRLRNPDVGKHHRRRRDRSLLVRRPGGAYRLTGAGQHRWLLDESNGEHQCRTDGVCPVRRGRGHDPVEQPGESHPDGNWHLRHSRESGQSHPHRFLQSELRVHRASEPWTLCR